MKTFCLPKIVVTLCTVFAFCGTFATASRAATYTVNSIADTNVCDNTTCTLRGAINAANGSSGADTITFSVTGTILLESVLPNLGDDVTISGPGANVLTVKRDSSAAAFRIFTVNNGKTVTLSGLTISGGSSDHAAGIENDSGTLNVTNCIVSGNTVSASAAFSSTASEGGAIFNVGGTLNVTGSTFSGNTATCDSSPFGDCSASAGAIFNNPSATVNVTNSTFSQNSVTCTAIVQGCTAQGGTFYNLGTLNLTSTTISDSNATCSGPGCIAQGGGILTQGTVTLQSTIIANSTGGDVQRLTGTVNAGYSLIEDGLASVNGTNSNNLTGDPNLGPLAYYGGPTAAHILKTGSQAIDKGKNFSGATTDQRGPSFARTVGSAAVSGGDGTDIGAFERQASDIDPTLIVTTTADTNTNNTCDPANPCSLRDAITAANASGPDDVIYFAVTGTIDLQTALPHLTGNTKILGPGANALTVTRDATAAAFGIFAVNSGNTATIAGLTITRGADPAPDQHGVGEFAGGIYNDHATLAVNNCTIKGNSDSGITNNGSQFGSATLTVANSTLSGNPGVQGGGIYNFGSGGSATLTINNSTLSGNSALDGGGIYNNALGGGSATLTVNNSTFSGNTVAPGSFTGAGGIFNDGEFGGNATVTIGDTVLNAGATGVNIVNYNGTITSLGYNLSSDAAGGDATTGPDGFLNATGDQRNTDPMLGPLQDNGGPTFTHALICGSPAIDNGKNFAGTSTDQRGFGFARIFGSAVAAGGDGTDIGAFEVQTVCNHPPTAMDDGYTTDEDTPLNVPAPGVLGNDSDPDNGDSITAVLVSGPSHAASFSLNSDGSFSYTPASNYNSSDSFTYKARDSHNADSNTVTVTITINAVNDPPTFDSVATLSRKQGAGSTNSQIATVSDVDNSAGSLTVTVQSAPTGISVSNIINTDGTITADVAAACNATQGSNTVVLQVSDGSKTANGNLTVNVTASSAPTITVKAPSVLQPNVNHSYKTFTITQMVQSATDDCDGNLIGSVVIEKATSDEVENSPGPGDGNTLKDIVIAANCKSVQLRAERDGTKDGRVYLVTLRLSDSSGNVKRAVYKVSVPVGKGSAIDSGVAYTVTSSCPL